MLNLTRKIGYSARLISLSYLLWSSGEGLWLYIRPLYLQELGANPEQAGFVLSMFGAGRVLLIIPVMFLIDHYNPRRMMLPGWGFGLLSVFLMAIAPTWEFAILGLLTYGFSAVALIPANLYLTLAYQHDQSRDPEVSLHTIFTYSWAAAAAGLIISPALGGLLVDYIGMRALFALSSLWFVISTYIIAILPDYPLATPNPGGRNFRGMLRKPHFVMLIVLFFAAFTAGPLGYSLAPQFLEELHDYSTGALGGLGVMTSLGATFLSLWLGHILPRHAFLIGSVLLLVTFILFLLGGSLIIVAAAYFLYGGWFALRAVATSLIAEAVQPHQHGIAFVLIDLLYGMGGLIGPLFAGAIYVQRQDAPFTSAGLLTFLTLVAGVFLLNSRNHVPLSPYNDIETTGEPNIAR